ncbi:MAG: DUF6607 family protein [Bacteriovoracia bacterium]
MNYLPTLMMAFAAVVSVNHANAADTQLERGLSALKSMTGCYLVDYSYTETESLKEGYERDKRVYDVNQDKSVKEWVFADRVSDTRVRMQHVLFATDLNGKIFDGAFLRHTGEDWEYDAPFLYDYQGPLVWNVKDLKESKGKWTRRVTNLDDGLRYQCAAAWEMGTAYPEWTCDGYAPIPGRETRDMGRKDYNTLQRSTRIVAYGTNWLERQANTKIIHGKDNSRTPLAKELGKNWYVRLPDSECAPAVKFIEPQLPFWTLVRETWDEVFTGDRPFIEKVPQAAPPRFIRVMELEEEYAAKDLKNPDVRKAARAELLKIIADYRSN